MNQNRFDRSISKVDLYLFLVTKVSKFRNLEKSSLQALHDNVDNYANCASHTRLKFEYNQQVTTNATLLTRLRGRIEMQPRYS